MKQTDIGSFLKNQYEIGVQMRTDPYFQLKLNEFTHYGIPWIKLDQPGTIEVQLPEKQYQVMLLNQKDDPEGIEIKILSDNKWITCTIEQFIKNCTAQINKNSGVVDWLEKNQITFTSYSESMVRLKAGKVSMYLDKVFYKEGLISVYFNPNGKAYKYSTAKILELIQTHN